MQLTSEHQVIIFDCDGTLIDTESVIFASWQKSFRDYNCEYDVADFQRCIGGSDHGFEPAAILERQLGRLIDRTELEASFRGYLQVIDEEPLCRGVREFLEGCRQASLPMAVGSSSSRSWVTHILKQRQIESFFRTIITKDDVEQVKPSPDIFLKVSETLGVAPKNCLVLEDSRNGLLAAKAAGMSCIVIPNVMTAAMDFREADGVVSAMSELRLPD